MGRFENSSIAAISTVHAPDSRSSMLATAAAGTTPQFPADLQHNAQALQAAVADLVRVYQFRDRDRICCHDISVTQCHTLEMLVEHGPMRLNDLTERLFLDKSTTSRVVRMLVKKGVRRTARRSQRWARPR